MFLLRPPPLENNSDNPKNIKSTAPLPTSKPAPSLTYCPKFVLSLIRF